MDLSESRRPSHDFEDCFVKQKKKYQFINNMYCHGFAIVSREMKKQRCRWQ